MTTKPKSSPAKARRKRAARSVIVDPWMERFDALNRAWVGKDDQPTFAIQPFKSRSCWKVYGTMIDPRPDWLEPWLPETYPVPLVGTDRLIGEAATRAEARAALIMSESLALGVASILLSRKPLSWSEARELMIRIAKIGWPGVPAEVTASAILSLPLGAPIPDTLTAQALLALVARAAMQGGWVAGPKAQRRRVVRGLWDGQRWARIMEETSRELIALPSIEE